MKALPLPTTVPCPSLDRRVPAGHDGRRGRLRDHGMLGSLSGCQRGCPARLGHRCADDSGDRARNRARILVRSVLSCHRFHGAVSLARAFADGCLGVLSVGWSCDADSLFDDLVHGGYRYAGHFTPVPGCHREAAYCGCVCAAGLCLGSIQLGVLVGNVAGARAIDSVRALPDGMFALAFVLMCVLACSQVLLAHTESQPSVSSPASARVRFPAFGTVRRIVSEDEFRTAVSRSRARAFLDEEGQSSAGCSEQGRALRDEDASLTHEEEIDARCVQLADEFGLSLREQEVLGYLGRGRSQPYILATSSFFPRTRSLPT